MSALAAIEQQLNQLLLNPAYHDILAILKGARNGIVYGVKVRFPHALIMSLIFHRTPWQTRAKFIFKATKQHALNLAKFVSIYKTVLLLQRRLAHRGKEGRADTFWAGLVGGWMVFGNRNAVNEQIVLYVVSRVISSFLPRAKAALSSNAAPAKSSIPPSPPSAAMTPPGYPYPKSQPPDAFIFKIYAAIAWGSVMYLFRHKRDHLQGGMVSSMQYLYLDSEVWSGWKNFLWHNA